MCLTDAAVRANARSDRVAQRAIGVEADIVDIAFTVIPPIRFEAAVRLTIAMIASTVQVSFAGVARAVASFGKN